MAEEGEQAALDKLCAFKCATVADVNIRAEYLGGLSDVCPDFISVTLAAPLAVKEARS